ncbi:glucose 1-dehydrogenase [Gordonia sp. HY002]|uniref:SDR family NAD(P)-dependent oxidoreductase n=1 Tax=Gordonia zhenghanii TaxID=2911516 RepID=UPI001EF0557F|nr:glucose 1-dehydrogenase [Gordonia zhenghanii]MCF8570185.1 glucose 1-dehydrogenase [Gordonia zhenghanii]MCF8608130.1 glucose 1-dehydrogenase [Gordonia zhenghanii]
MSATSYDLTGKVALVTGGSRGLGRAMVQALAEAGADVVIASRKLDACEVAAQEVRASTGRRALPLAYHVGNWDDAEPTVDAIVKEFGRLDILINNAGMSPLYDGVETISEALWDKVFDVNLKGPFALSIAAGQQMATQGGGSIISISSRASERPRPHTLPYAAAKAGLNAMTVALAHALGPDVRVNAIIAGTFLTDVSKSWDADAFAQRAQTFALGRGGDPTEITGAALYLASDASSYTTGSMLTVDGGQP